MPISELSRLPVSAPWMTGEGPESDVVVSSRIRLARNVSGFPYPNSANREARAALLGQIQAVVHDELFPEPFDAETLELVPADLSQGERAFLDDRSLADDDLPARLIVGSDERLVVHLDGADHLRIAVTQSGLDLHPALAEARRVDLMLESRLQYAVALDWGYLSSRITDLGTGMRASVLVHVPALAALGRLSSMSRSMGSSGYELIPFRREDAFAGSPVDADETQQDPARGSISASPAEIAVRARLAANAAANSESAEPSLCLLRNLRSLGSSEDVIATKLEDYASKLVHYERAAREELVRDEPSLVADAANRALGILRFARSLTALEARDLVSQLRLGVVAGLVEGVAARTVTSLLLIGGDSQAARWTPAADQDDIDRVRARIFRDVLLEE